MPNPIMRIGDFGIAGGFNPNNPAIVILSPGNRGTVFVEQKSVSINGDRYQSHSDGDTDHEIPQAVCANNNSVFAYGVLIHTKGDYMSCDPSHIANIGCNRTFVS
jgi:hypothetical protein